MANALTIRLDHKTLAVSQEVAHSASFPMRGRMEVLTHGVPLSSIRGRAVERATIRERLGVGEDTVVMTVANLRDHKDYPTLFEAAALAVSQGPGLRFLAVGQGPLESELRSKLASQDLGDRFRMLGYQADPIGLLAGADIFALSSVHEGLPIALLEAMALGVAPVATSVGGVPEVIDHGVSGLLVPARSPRHLADAILRLARDPDERNRLARGAMARSEAFDIARARERLDSIYRRD